MPRTLPLAGLKVVAIEQAVAAPFASSRLADAGAEVIKIERPEGDFARGYDNVAAGQSSYFVWLNRGKSSITLDLASDASKRALAGHLQDSDVLLQNLKRGALAKLGFDLVGLQRDHPHLRRITVDTPNGPVSYPAPAPVFGNEARSYGPVPALNAIDG